MFSKKPQAAEIIKKSSLKVQDQKKDVFARLKHLKTILEHVDNDEAKAFFEANYSHIFYILHETFVQAETNLKQRELSFHLVHKAHREELDGSIWLLGKVIYLLPELIAKRWQCHSTSRILMKLLHHGNSTKLRREGVRYFLMWYQALGIAEHGAPEEAHQMFSELVPGMTVPQKNRQGPQSISPTSEIPAPKDYVSDLTNHPNFRISGSEMGQSVFHDQPTKAPDMTPLILPSLNERTITPDPRDGLEILLESMVCSTGYLKWSDCNVQRHFRGFHFLLQRFREVYLPVFCPNFDNSATIYDPKLDLPGIRAISKREEVMGPCVVVLINWVSKYTNERHSMHKLEHQIFSDDVPEQASLVSNLRHIGYTQSQIVRDVLYSTRDTINFVNEVYRQAFLLNFTSRSCIDAMKISISTYREWMSCTNPPLFLLEESDGSSAGSSLDSASSGRQRLRTDSYVGAIQGAQSIRAGMQNVLQVFVTNAVNVFMVPTSHLNMYLPSKTKEEATTPLDEQTEICKRVLNIYRTMVMKTKMESKTWEQLLMVLLQITSVILAQAPPNSKRNNLGGRLAQPIFQTLIVTWIRAHTNVVVHSSMWEKFLKVLSSLTHREELIVEWDKTMQTLTRVLARQVYNLNLQDLPLDRLAEQKGKRRRVGVSSAASGVNNVWSGLNSQGLTSDNQHTTPINTNSINARGRDENNCEPRAMINHHIRVPGTPMMNRSYSEGSLAITPYRKSRARRRGKIHQHHRHQMQELPIDMEQTLSRMSTQLSVSMEILNISKISTGENHQIHLHHQQQVRRALSLDSIRQQKMDDNESFRDGSRSPSPTASSGLDGNSMKDSPHAIDAIAQGDSSSLETHDDNLDRRSILAGGTAKGWLPDVAAIMWRRMLGALGDVNKILNPKLHAEVFRYLVNITDSMIKIRLNQGISNDNQSTPSQPTLVPPIAMFLPWCYGALALDSQFQLGKVYAMQLICMIARNTSLSGDQLPMFYQALHSSLTGENRQMAATALKYLGGPRFLSLLMPGHSLLFLDLIHACTMVLTSMDVKGPRAEAAGLLGSLLCYPKTSLPGPILQPSEPLVEVMECPDLQEHILNIVLRCARREISARARSIAITSLGQWILQNLTNPNYAENASGERKKSQPSSMTIPNMRIAEAFQVILQALQFKHRVISRVACETLRLCAEMGNELSRIEKLPALTIEALCYSLEIQNIPNPKDCDKNVLTSMLLTLGELCMAFRMNILMESTSDDKCPLLSMIFKVLHRIGTGKYTDMRGKSCIIDEDFEMNITVDDIKEHSHSEANYQTHETIQQCQAAIQLCAKTVAMHLVTNISHFPLGIGASRLSSMVDEHDDSFSQQNARESIREASVEMYASQVLTAPNLQLLMLSSELVASFVELPALKLPSADGLITANKQVRMILRDLNGKSCWDASIIYCEPKTNNTEAENTSDEVDFDCSMRQKYRSSNFGMKNNQISLDPMISSVGFNFNVQPPHTRHTLRHRPAHQLPLASDISPDLDQLDDLLQFIGYTSPECLDANNQSLNVSGPSPLGINLEAQTIAVLLNQRAMESDFISRKNQQTDLCSTTSDFFNSNSLEFASIGDDITVRSTTSSKSLETRQQQQNHDMSLSSSTLRKQDSLPFHFGRLLFNQLGYAGWERRKKTHLLSRTDKLLRELRNLDAQKCRETHKMAVIYVANGQEDKNSILRNSSGSSTYEMFVSALGWEVELETHHGFLGGLPRQGCGQTAPYFATPFLEVIFHVSTRIPSDTHEAILNKTRHLGNDEVHIVWSEHNRDYRRDILPTEFCDVLIVIYPLKSGLFRVTVNRKQEVPWFGPISDEMVVSGTVLANLVRSSAINASRAKRYAMPFYQQYYEERNRSLETVASRHKESKTFEEFMTKIYSPIMMNMSHSVTSSGTITAAALIDHQHVSHRSSVKNTSNNWFQHHITQRQQSDLSDSPSMLRKLPFCHNLPKKSSSSSTIPSSPLSPTSASTGRRFK